MPVLTRAILFGLSMDYQVFLISRMNEEWVRGRDSWRAVRIGQLEAARVITAAAAITICVFLTFSFLGQRNIAEFGIGLAAAVARPPPPAPGHRALDTYTRRIRPGPRGTRS